MTCFWPFTSITSGVQKENLRLASLLRATFHRVLPVFVSKAITLGLAAASALKMSKSSTITGLPPVPCTGA